MDVTPPLARQADERSAGVVCPHCDARVRAGEPILSCPACGAVQHNACWEAAGRCGSYECAPARRELPADRAPALTISAADLDQAVPWPTRPAAPAGPRFPADPPAPRLNRLAVASLVCALAGIPLFGLVTGLVAIVLGSVALGAINAQRQQKGAGWAVTGILLGLGDVVGWVVFLSFMLGGGGPALRTEDFLTDPSALATLDPAIERGMRANVLIGELPRFGRGGLGSGVILKIADHQALVLTNRHVIDPAFAGGSRDAPADLGKLTPRVKLLGAPARDGTVVWVAPGGIDLALVHVAYAGGDARAARWQIGRPLVVGAPVFAIGNPHGLGWTHTQGTISQLRVQKIAGRDVRVIQTQTVINHGNSGGGLYDRDGYLIGIATWTQDKRVSEGLNFAIALDVLGDLPVPDLDPHAGSEEKESP